MAQCEKCGGDGRRIQRQLVDTGFEMRRRGSYSQPAALYDWKNVDVGPCLACDGTGKAK